jgi:hypothetical protein
MEKSIRIHSTPASHCLKFLRGGITKPLVALLLWLVSLDHMWYNEASSLVLPTPNTFGSTILLHPGGSPVASSYVRSSGLF